jgi:tetratricopeptide (TPR) repeat protein
MAGLGNSHLEVTATPEAQIWFDQGLNALHDFWDYEAARAFEQGIRVDAQCAMCYWGLYRAESFYLSTAQDYAGQSLAKAVALKEHASERERLYIDASTAHEDALKNPGPLGPAFAKEMQVWRKLVTDYPDDVQARIFFARRAGGREALETFQAILKDNPNDSAANHYYIHELEGGPHPELALHSADIVAGLAPASGHMVHMPGHIYFRIGDYVRAEQAFASSMDVDERYMREQHVQPDDDWNYVHNLMYGIANLMEEGKLSAATALSARLTAARGELLSSLYVNSSRDSISRLDPRLPVALRTADWAQVLKLLRASGASARPNLDFLSRQLITFAEGMQAIETRDLTKAETLSARFDAELKHMNSQSSDAVEMSGPTMGSGPPTLQVMPDALLRPLLNSLNVMSLELRGSLSAAEGQPTDAMSLFSKAAQAEIGLGYHEPPASIRPVGEAEAAAMMAIGHWTDAIAAYERALRQRPRSGFALYGIALCREKAGATESAVKSYLDFLVAWKGADSTLPQVSHAKEFVASHSATGPRG